jgi:hypothetical protein
MAAKNKLLTVLSEAEQYALYGLPDFNDAQRLEYLALSENELMLAANRPGLHDQDYCILQIGYFKAKQTFFRFDWSDVEDGYAFVLSHYFIADGFERKPVPTMSITPSADESPNYSATSCGLPLSCRSSHVRPNK